MRRNFDLLADGRFDLLVIGGGIYGAWTAYDAALRGLRVALVERSDWAAGTSSASSKLIHGGLRYLERLKLGLVRSSLSERRLLARLAPHRVQPLRFLIPHYRGARVGRVRWRLGLWLYDRLAGSGQPVAPHRSLSPDAVADVCPFLQNDGLLGAVSYGDCATDDARCVVEIVDGAVAAGVTAANRAEVTRLRREGAAVIGAEIRDGETNQTIDVRSTMTVDCTGAWSARRAWAGSGHVQTRITKGVHLVLPGLATTHALLLLAPADGRVFFVIPWYGRTLLGTTDTPYTGSLDAIRADADDVTYLLNAVNGYLKQPWRPDQVQASFAGLRVLQDQPDADPSDVTREWVMEEPEPGLVTSVGGKYSTARRDASQMVDLVVTRAGQRPGVHPTAERRFPWAPPGEVPQWLEDMVARGVELGVDAETARVSAFRFGTRVDAIHDRIGRQPDLAARLDPGLPFCRAEVVHAVEDEMARSLEDVLRRRIPLTILSHPPQPVLADAAALAGAALKWTPEQQRDEIQRLTAAIPSAPDGAS